MKITENTNTENFDLISETRKKLYGLFTKKKSELYLAGKLEDSDEFTTLVENFNYGLSKLKEINVSSVEDQLNKLLIKLR